MGIDVFRYWNLGFVSHEHDFIRISCVVFQFYISFKQTVLLQTDEFSAGKRELVVLGSHAFDAVVGKR